MPWENVLFAFGPVAGIMVYSSLDELLPAAGPPPRNLSLRVVK
jgi:hypothetical protein